MTRKSSGEGRRDEASAGPLFLPGWRERHARQTGVWKGAGLRERGVARVSLGHAGEQREWPRGWERVESSSSPQEGADGHGKPDLVQGLLQPRRELGPG